MCSKSRLTSHFSLNLKVIHLLFPHQSAEETVIKEHKHKQASTGIQTSYSDFVEEPCQWLSTTLNLLWWDAINTPLLDLESFSHCSRENLSSSVRLDEECCSIAIFTSLLRGATRGLSQTRPEHCPDCVWGYSVKWWGKCEGVWIFSKTPNSIKQD